MAKTVRTEVERDEDGSFWMVRVVESDVPSEGGRERVTRVDRLSVAGTIQQVEEKVASIQADLDRHKATRAMWYDIQKQIIEAEDTAEADAAGKKAKK